MTEDIKPDFHVVSLQYRLYHSDDVTFNNPPPVEFETDKAKLQLKDGILFCELKTHYGTESVARAAIEPILRAWELDAAIRGSFYGLKFVFDKAEIIDRTPIVPGQTRIVTSVGALCMDAILCSATVRVGKAKYPDPPLTFRLTPDVESLWLRYKAFIDGREPLLAMAYVCLTILEASVGNPRAGRRARAAKKFGIDATVLGKLGELTSKGGDRLTARKVEGIQPMRPLTGPETEWIQSVVKALILRVGDSRDIASLPKITMADFPKL